MIRDYPTQRRLFVALCSLLCIASLIATPEVLLAARSRSTGHRPTVIVDAGHGGFDRGGIPGQRVPEKTMALDVSQRLARKLRDAGYRVIMTRDSDVFVPLPTRVAIANSHRDAIFVCIHFNSATRSGANGIETYYYGNGSARLAANIHRHVIGIAPTANRGIRRRGYYVLRRTDIPAVLVECGFLTNPYEARLALQSSYRDRLAQSIADGVMGRPTPPNRPVESGLVHVRSPLNDRYNDFVSAGRERSHTRHHRSRRSHRSRHHHHSSKSSSRKKSSSKHRKHKKKSED